MEASWPDIEGRIDGWWGEVRRYIHRVAMQHEFSGVLVLNLSGNSRDATAPHRKTLP
jgi:hypothetical protein